jgi:hypothetical protein
MLSAYFEFADLYYDERNLISLGAPICRSDSGTFATILDVAVVVEPGTATPLVSSNTDRHFM